MAKKKSTAKSSAAKGKTADKKKTVAKKSETKKTAAKKSTEKSAAKKKAAPKKGAAKKAARNRKPTKRELKTYEKLLWELRDRITEEMSFLSGDNVSSNGQNGNGRDISRSGGDAGDQGAANFDREFALNLMSSESDIIYEIDQALQRIKDGTYGICEMSGKPIEKERLKAIPYARYSVAAKTELEQQQSGRRTRTK